LLGMVGFFLPCLAVSCGPMRLTFSGYEVATGSYQDKLSQQGIGSFWNRTADEPNRQSGSRLRPLPKNQKAKGDHSVQNQPAQGVPALWSIPAACLILLVLAVNGVPRLPTIVVSVLGSAYLAYFGVSFEQQLNDPRNTGGILTHEWLSGYWLGWIGLLGPMSVAILRPHRRVLEEDEGP